MKIHMNESNMKLTKKKKLERSKFRNSYKKIDRRIHLAELIKKSKKVLNIS